VRTLIFLGAITDARAQEKRNWFSRVMHPFGSSEKIPEYKNPKLRGLILAAEIPQEPVKLSEVRQLPVRVTLTNRGAQAVETQFSNGTAHRDSSPRFLAPCGDALV
jgi:hypothetical protein